MANLDSTNKRRSATGIFHLYTIPWNPDAGDSAENREHSTMIYAGISPGVAAVVYALYDFIARLKVFNFNGIPGDKI